MRLYDPAGLEGFKGDGFGRGLRPNMLNVPRKMFIAVGVLIPSRLEASKEGVYMLN